jgi:hypothetical protein
MVGDFQRCLLDCWGLVLWIDVFYPRTKSRCFEEVGKKWPVDDTILGCFTLDPNIVQMLHQIGIPVIYVRPDFAVAFHDTRIYVGARCLSATVPPNVSLCHYLPFDVKESPMPLIYQGFPGTDLQRRLQKLSANIIDQTVPSKAILNKMEAKLHPVTTQEGQSFPPTINSTYN